MKRNLLNGLFTLLLLLAAGQPAWAQATFPVEVSFQGLMNGEQYAYVITSGLHTPYNSGVQSLTYSDVRIDGQSFDIGSADVPLTMTVNGHFTFPTTSGDATVSGMNADLVFTSGSKYITAVSVSTYSGTPVSVESITGTSFVRDVNLLQNTTFGKVTLTMATHTPLDYAATIGGIEATYLDDGVNQPVPTVTYQEGSSPAITLTEGEDYTVSYSVGSTGGTVTVTGMGDYIGSKSKSYNIRQLQLSDFHQLSDGSYEIATKQDLDNLAKFVNNGNNCSGVTFRQTANIAYTSECTWDNNGVATLAANHNFTSIGGYGKSFSGTYDGDGYTISGLRMYRFNKGTSGTDNRSIGLFGYVSGGTVQNVVLRDANIYAYQDFAGIVGYLGGGSVTGCTLYHVRVATGNNYFNNQNIVVGNHASGTVIGNYYRDCIRRHVIQASEDNIERCNNVYTLATADNTTAAYQSGASVTIDDVTYYAEGSTFTLGYSGNTPGANVVFSATSGSIDGSILTMPAEDVTVSVTITSCSLTLTQGTLNGVTAYWGTFYSNGYNFSLPEGAEAFIMASDYTLCRLGDDGRTVPKGVPVVIMALLPDVTPKVTVYLVQAGTGDLNIDRHGVTNILHASSNDVTVTAGKVDGKTPYVLGVANGVAGFYKYTGTSIPYYKAYLLK